MSRISSVKCVWNRLKVHVRWPLRASPGDEGLSKPPYRIGRLAIGPYGMTLQHARLLKGMFLKSLRKTSIRLFVLASETRPKFNWRISSALTNDSWKCMKTQRGKVKEVEEANWPSGPAGNRAMVLILPSVINSLWWNRINVVIGMI